MKFTVLFLGCALMSLSATAQWSSFKKLTVFRKREHRPELSSASCIGLKPVPNSPGGNLKKLYHYNAPPTDYSLELAEAAMMKTAQHNMRFRVYDAASYNFNALASLYMQQNRLSEAKWFFLQSNLISRGQNNDRLTIANLLQLATIKSSIGDVVLAQQDLLEAREMASSKGYFNELLDVEKKLSGIQHNLFVSLRTDLRYDDAVKTIAMAN